MFRIYRAVLTFRNSSKESIKLTRFLVSRETRRGYQWDTMQGNLQHVQIDMVFCRALAGLHGKQISGLKPYGEIQNCIVLGTL